MSIENTFTPLIMLIGQLPVILVWLFGLALAAYFWKRAPRPALLTMVAIIGFFLLAVVNVFVNGLIPTMMLDRGIGYQEMSLILGLASIGQSIFTAVLWLILLAAIFNGRAPAEEKAPPN